MWNLRRNSRGLLRHSALACSCTVTLLALVLGVGLGSGLGDSFILAGPISAPLRVPPERPFRPASRIGDSFILAGPISAPLRVPPERPFRPASRIGDSPVRVAQTLSVAPSTKQPLRQQLQSVKSFALALGIEPTVEILASFDLVIIDGDSASKALVKQLHGKNKLVLAYVSAGTLEPYRSWFPEAKKKGYALKYWPEWGEYYAKVSDPGMQKLLLKQTSRYFASGVDGLFLDNTDMIEAEPLQRDGMITLVRALRKQAADRLLFTQNGIDIVDLWADQLDGWNYESVATTYDFATKKYLPQQSAVTVAINAKLQALARTGVFITTTDYTSSANSPLASRAIANACRIGAVPFVSNIALSRLPKTAAACPKNPSP
jgi:uncharacterized protein (TIGR01370 family)